MSELMLHDDMEFGGADTAALDLLERYGSANFEGDNRAGDDALLGPGIGQGTYQHVAANSRKCVQVTGQGHVSSWWHKHRAFVEIGFPRMGSFQRAYRI